MKKFYKEAAIAAAGSGYAVTLDCKGVRTPGRAALVVPARRLAEGIAGEWMAQADEIDPQSMPLTRFANSAIDRIAPRRAAVVDEIAGYAGTDLLCYRVDTPETLATRQASAWQPLLDWAAAQYDAPLRVTFDVLPLEQPPEALSALRAAVEAHDDFQLSGLHSLTTACGSVVLGLAVSAGRLPPRDAGAASLLDELYQSEKWGEEREAVQRRNGIQAEIDAAARFLEHLTD